MSYAFKNLRTRAQERGIAFSLTFEQYEQFAISTDYAKLKGKTSLSLSCDRKDNSLGYHHWNIQAITVRENCRKQFVAYFNGGLLPADQRAEYLEFERGYRAKCEKLAAAVMKKFEAGSKEFWKEFTRLKDKMFSREVHHA